MQRDIFTVLSKLTPSKPPRDVLADNELQNLKIILKNDPSLNSAVFSFIQQRSKANSVQVRYLTFQVVNYIFCRSAHFRSLLCRSYVLPFFDNFLYELPPPESTGKKLKSFVYDSVREWRKRFGKIYPQLKILESELKKIINKKDIVVYKDQSYKVNLILDTIKMRYSLFFKEINNILDLMDKDKCNFVIPSDEYTQIVIDQLKDRKKQMNDCAYDIGVLKSQIRQYAIQPEIKEEINQIVECFNSIEKKANQIGLNDDEFEDFVDEEEEANSDKE